MNQHIETINKLTDEIGRPVQFMEVCGTHTMAAFRTGLRSLLPAGLSLLSGPGCPVCVTPKEYLDRAIAIANEPDTVVVTFGDMMRVPGTESSLERARAFGSDVRVVYSPLDALLLARSNQGKRVIFLGVGFETTAPAVAWTLKEAKRTGASNFFVLCAHKTIPEAMAALLEGGDVHVDGFLCPGHVSVIIGSRAYEPVCRKHHIPCVVAGFEAADMGRAIAMLLQQIVDKRAEVEIEYTRSVTPNGNAEAQNVCNEVFEKCDAAWRGLGLIPESGLRIREEFAAHDADKSFSHVELPEKAELEGDSGCICGDVLRGARLPSDCGLFGKKCTPASPVGPCMVSSEGTCAAYYKYAKISGKRSRFPVPSSRLKKSIRSGGCRKRSGEQ